MDRFDDVLNICFSNDDKILSSKVVFLFTKINPNIIDFDKFNSLLINKANKLLEQKVEDQRVIGRLSSIILYSALNCRNKSAVLAPLIIKLLAYVSYSGCAEIYHTLCDYNAESTEIEEALVQANFSNSIMYFLSKSEDNETISQLIKIIRMSAGNKIMKHSVRKPEICVQLFHFLKTEDHEIKTQIWRCLTALISEQTCLTLKQVIDNALSVVGESFDRVDMFRIFAFDFIGKLLHFLPSIAEELVSKQFLEITFKCIIQFPEATHLIASVFRFIRTAFTIPAMKKWFFSVFVPFMMATVKSKERNSAKSYCFLLLSDLEKAGEKDYQLKETLMRVHGYTKFCNEVLYPQLQVQNAHYGGKINRDPISPFMIFVD